MAFSDKLVAVIMVKNEAERIERTTLPSIVGIKHMVLFDTGSTDNTVDIFYPIILNIIQ